MKNMCHIMNIYHAAAKLFRLAALSEKASEREKEEGKEFLSKISHSRVLLWLKECL